MRGQSEATLQTGMCDQKTLDISWGQEVTYQNYFQLIEWHTIVYSIFSQVWLALSLGHLYNEGGQVTKPIILVKICYKLLYVIQLVENSFW